MSHYNRLLRDALIKWSGYYKTSNGWIGVKCPFCGDSKKEKSVHLFVRISNNEDDNVYMTRCFRTNCGHTGILKASELVKFGIINSDLFSFVQSQEYKSYKKIKTVDKEDSKLIISLDSYSSKEIQEYMIKRIGIDAQDSDVRRRLRFIPDIRNFILKNQDVLAPSDSLKYIWDNADTSVCFLNKNGTRIFARHINPINDRKHSIATIVNIPDYAVHTPYTIVNGIGEYDIDNFHYALCEGIFDILNMYLYISGGVSGIFEATGSASSIRNRFLRASNYYYDINWIMGKDSDVSMDFFQKLKKTYDYRFKNPLSIVYSENTKDIGDLSEKFIPKKKIIY